jgi:soluble P-type ATPase
LLKTFRIAKNVITGDLEKEVETTMLTFADPERVLCVIQGHSQDIINAPQDMLLSEYIRINQIGFGISCTRKVVAKDEVKYHIMNDTRAYLGDLQECIRDIWSKIKQEEIVTLNTGMIIHLEKSGIEYTIAAGGSPFEGAREMVDDLQKRGIATYIASGDRETKLEKMADYLGIPRDRVFGIATPTVKEQIVKDLKETYDTVIMVGDSINDLRAMRAADISVLTMQQSADKPEELILTADIKIHDLREVPGIVKQVEDGLITSLKELRS